MAAWQSSVRDVARASGDVSSTRSWRHSDSSRSPSPLSGKLPIDMLSPFTTALPQTARSQERNVARVATTPSWTAVATRTLSPPMGIASVFAAAGGGRQTPTRSRSPSPLTTALPAVRRSRTPSPQPTMNTSQAAGNLTVASASGIAHVGLLPPSEPITDEGGPRAAAWFARPMAEGRQWVMPPVPSRAGAISAAAVVSGQQQATPTISAVGVAMRKHPPSPLWPASLPAAPGSASSTAVVSAGNPVAAVAAGEFAVHKLRKEVSDLRAELRQVRAALSDTPATSRSPSLVSFGEVGDCSLSSSRVRKLSTGSHAPHEKNFGPTFGNASWENIARPVAQLGKPLLSPIRSTTTSPEKMNGISGISGVTPPPWPSGGDVSCPSGIDVQQQDEALSFACDLQIAASAGPRYNVRDYEDEWSETVGADHKARRCPSLADTLLGATGAGTTETHAPDNGKNGKEEVVLLREELPWSGVNLGGTGTHNPGLHSQVGQSFEVPNHSRLGQAFGAPGDSLACTFQGNRGCHAPARTEDELMDAAVTGRPISGQGSSTHLVQNGHGAQRQSNAVEPRSVTVKARTENTPGSTSCDEDLFTPSKDDSGSCILVRRASQAPFAVGEQVKVLVNVTSACQEAYLIPVGTLGRILHFDDEGDALIDFDTIPKNTWIAEEHLRKLTATEVSSSQLEVSYVMSSRDEDADIPLLDKDLAWTKALPAPPPTFSIPARKKETTGIVRKLPLPEKYMPPAPVVSHFARDDNFGQTTLMTSGMSELLVDDTTPTSTSVLIGMTSPMMDSVSLAASVDASLSMQSSTSHAQGAPTPDTIISGLGRSVQMTDFTRSPQSGFFSDTSGLQRTCQRSASHWGSFQSSSSTTLQRASANLDSGLSGSFSSSLEPKYFAVPAPKESFSVPPVPSADLLTTPMRQALGGNTIPTGISLPSAPLTPAVSVSTSRTATPPSRNTTPRRQQRLTAPSTVLSMGSVPSRSSSPSTAAVQVSSMGSVPSRSSSPSTAVVQVTRTAAPKVAPTISGTSNPDATLQGVGRTRSSTPQRRVLSGYGSARSTPSIATVSRDSLPARTPG